MEHVRYARFVVTVPGVYACCTDIMKQILCVVGTCVSQLRMICKMSMARTICKPLAAQAHTHGDARHMYPVRNTHANARANIVMPSSDKCSGHPADWGSGLNRGCSVDCHVRHIGQLLLGVVLPEDKAEGHTR